MKIIRGKKAVNKSMAITYSLTTIPISWNSEKCYT